MLEWYSSHYSIWQLVRIFDIKIRRPQNCHDVASLFFENPSMAAMRAALRCTCVSAEVSELVRRAREAYKDGDEGEGEGAGGGEEGCGEGEDNEEGDDEGEDEEGDEEEGD